MFVMSPNDNKVSDRHGADSLKDRDFGGNRKVTNDIQSTVDYKKPSLARRANLDTPYDGTTRQEWDPTISGVGAAVSGTLGGWITVSGTFDPDARVREVPMDVDDMNDSQARKRETTRRAETSTTGYDQESNAYRRPGDADDKTYSDADNRPESEHREDDVVREPDPNKKHGTRNPWRIGEDHDKRGDQNIGHTQKPR